jgi:glutamate transport system substrate-binding protein
MRFIRTKAVIATVGLALSLAACGDAGDDGGETTDVEVQRTPATSSTTGRR